MLLFDKKAKLVQQPFQKTIRGKGILVTLKEYFTQGFACFSRKFNVRNYLLIVKKTRVL